LKLASDPLRRWRNSAAVAAAAAATSVSEAPPSLCGLHSRSVDRLTPFLRGEEPTLNQIAAHPQNLQQRSNNMVQTSTTRAAPLHF